MAIAPIHTWLSSSNKPYEQGLELYKKFARSKSALLPILEAGETRFTRKKLTALLEELQKNRQELEETEPLAYKIKYQPPKRKQKPKPRYRESALPDELKPRYARAKQLYRESAELRSRLKQSDLKTRKKYIAQIIKNFNETQGVWDELDFWNQNGEIITEEEKKLDAATVLRKLHNARSNRSKYKGVRGKESLYAKWQAVCIKMEELYNGFI